jgi:hypothetical protein
LTASCETIGQVAAVSFYVDTDGNGSTSAEVSPAGVRYSSGSVVLGADDLGLTAERLGLESSFQPRGRPKKHE